MARKCLAMLITIVSATAFEVLRLRQMLAPGNTPEQTHFSLGNKTVHLLHTGIGIANTALHLSHYLQHHKPNLVIHAGIAGAYRRDIPLCAVGIVQTEAYADLGAEMADGTIQDLFTLGFMSPEVPPFTQGFLVNESVVDFNFLPKWHGLTVNLVSGTHSTIQKLLTRYPKAQIENMEGAAFFQTCAFYAVPFLAVRSISNYVEVRNRANWRVTEAVEQLNQVVFQMLQEL